jgi:hypothetical protein
VGKVKAKSIVSSVSYVKFVHRGVNHICSVKRVQSCGLKLRFGDVSPLQRGEVYVDANNKGFPVASRSISDRDSHGSASDAFIHQRSTEIITPVFETGSEANAF